MKNVCKLLATLIVSVAAFSSTANAVGVGPASTYTDVVWSVSTTVPELAGCNTLRVDATGDLNNGKRLGVHGNLNCQNGAYAITGTAYFDDQGLFNMELFAGAGLLLQCPRFQGLSGRCDYLVTGTGRVLGSAFLTLR